MSVLVVEDNRDLNEMLSLALTAKDYRVKSSFDGEEGLRDFFEYQPDIVLLDLMMPKIDGQEVFKKILKSKYNPHIVIVSNLDKDKLEEKELFDTYPYLKKSDYTPKQIIDEVIKSFNEYRQHVT